VANLAVKGGAVPRREASHAVVEAKDGRGLGSHLCYECDSWSAGAIWLHSSFRDGVVPHLEKGVGG